MKPEREAGRRKKHLLSEHDVKEVVKFQQYLHDRQEMPLDDFLRKYQDYMGLTDDERDALQKRGMRR